MRDKSLTPTLSKVEGGITKADLAQVDVLTHEIALINDLLATEQDDRVAEALRQERSQLVAYVNQVLGTGHIGREMIFINNLNSV